MHSPATEGNSAARHEALRRRHLAGPSTVWLSWAPSMTRRGRRTGPATQNVGLCRRVHPSWHASCDSRVWVCMN